MYDSELGFRHGPKSIIDDNTLTIAYLSDDEYRRRYELDLVKEMAHQRKGNKIAVVYNHDCEGIEDQDRSGHGERSAGSGLHPVCSDHRSDEVSVSGHYPGQPLPHW